MILKKLLIKKKILQKFKLFLNTKYLWGGKTVMALIVQH